MVEIVHLSAEEAEYVADVLAEADELFSALAKAGGFADNITTLARRLYRARAMVVATPREVRQVSQEVQ